MGYKLLSEKLKRSGNGMAQRLGSMMRKDKYEPGGEMVEDYLKTSVGTGKTLLSRPILGVKKLIKKLTGASPESIKGEVEHWDEFTGSRERALKQWLAEVEGAKFNKDRNKYLLNSEGNKQPIYEDLVDASGQKNRSPLEAYKKFHEQPKEPSMMDSLGKLPFEPFAITSEGLKGFAEHGTVVSPAQKKFKLRVDNLLQHVGNNYDDFVNIAEKVDPGLLAQMASTHAPVYGPYTGMAAGGLGAGVLGAGLTGKGIYDHLKNKENAEGSPLAKTAARKKKIKNLMTPTEYAETHRS
jgi:hypothetical protein